MEGIVFTYDSGDIQKIPSFLEKISKQVLRISG
jgi:hypothetical protein